MFATLQGYLAQFEGWLHGIKSFVTQNETDLAVLAAVIVLVAFVSWVNSVWKRIQFGREVRNSQVIAYRLDRIASALERVSRMQRSSLEVNRAAVPAQSQAEPEEAPRQAGVGSMFGFSSGMKLPNPMYRPR
ncbi:MAG TPA: hypothetical protein VJN21_13545 [Candidatus Acidoferrales bacterium]|nr:hypothetical protein [Candidatus Acidoferrales bacterium]